METIKKSATIGLLVLIAGIVAASLIWYSGEKARQSPAATSLYLNKTLEISLQYPAAWQSDPKSGGEVGISARYIGSDGYFGLDSIGGTKGATMDELIAAVTERSYRNVSLTAESGVVAGHESRLLIPPSGQSPETELEAVLVVRYRRPVVYDGKTYQFLILYSDRRHIRSLMSTVEMLDN